MTLPRNPEWWAAQDAGVRSPCTCLMLRDIVERADHKAPIYYHGEQWVIREYRYDQEARGLLTCRLYMVDRYGNSKYFRFIGEPRLQPFEKGYKIMPVECFENPFWLVVNEQNVIQSRANGMGQAWNEPLQIEDTEGAAIFLAEKCAAANPGKNYYVVKSVTRSKSTNTVTTRYR